MGRMSCAFTPDRCQSWAWTEGLGSTNCTVVGKEFLNVYVSCLEKVFLAVTNTSVSSMLDVVRFVAALVFRLMVVHLAVKCDSQDEYLMSLYLPEMES